MNLWEERSEMEGGGEGNKKKRKICHFFFSLSSSPLLLFCVLATPPPWEGRGRRKRERVREKSFFRLSPSCSSSRRHHHQKRKRAKLDSWGEGGVSLDLESQKRRAEAEETPIKSRRSSMPLKYPGFSSLRLIMRGGLFLPMKKYISDTLDPTYGHKRKREILPNFKKSRHF